MPSQALGEFRKNLKDVRALVALHGQLSAPTRRGKRHLGHVTRGGIVLLCAAWERYVESVIEEGTSFLARNHSLASLPQAPKKLVTDFVNGGSSSFTAATLSANLVDAMREAVCARTDKLNTPKYDRLKRIFDTTLGIPDIASAWSKSTSDLDSFVSLRGEVAHRGGQSQYVRISHLTKLLSDVLMYVSETDNFLSDHLRGLVSPPTRPWNRS